MLSFNWPIDLVELFQLFIKLTANRAVFLYHSIQRLNFLSGFNFASLLLRVFQTHFDIGKPKVMLQQHPALQ